MKYFLSIILILISFYSFSEKNDTITAFDSTYVKSTSNFLSTYTYLTSSANKFEIKDISSGRSLKYAPNTGVSMGFGFSYKWLGLAFSFGLKNNEIEKKGKSESFNLSTTIFGRKNIIDAKLQLYSGFYIENPWIYDTSWVDTLNFPQRSDLLTNFASFSWVYVFNNKRFSYKAAFTQSEIQRKSAGSFLLGTFASYDIISADSSVLPVTARNNFVDNANFEMSDNLNITIGAGYVYSFIFAKHFYLTMSLMQGLGVQWIFMAYQNEDYDEIRTALSNNTQIRLGLGYNSLRDYFGLTAFTDISPLKSRNNKTQINFSSHYVKLFYGHRFDFNLKKNK